MYYVVLVTRSICPFSRHINEDSSRGQLVFIEVTLEKVPTPLTTNAIALMR